MKTFLPLVSVAIPTLNSEKTIEKTFLSIKKQSYPNIEVIVADGGSTDDTVLIAKNYNAIVCFAKELGRARHQALRKSKGAFILALDSDQFLGNQTIEKCVLLMTKRNYTALILNEESVMRRGTLVEKLLAYDKFIVNSSKDAHPVFGSSIPRFFLRKCLLKLTWPKTLSILDDAVLHKEFIKKNMRVGFMKGVCIRHYEVDSWKFLFKKFIRYGKLYIPTMQVSPETTIFHSLPRRVYFNKRVFSKPFLFLGLFFLYIVKGSAVLTGIMLYLLQKSAYWLKTKRDDAS